MNKHDTASLSLLWADGETGTDQAEGKAGKISADGKTVSFVKDTTTIPDCIIVSSDGRDGYTGNSADVVLMKYAGLTELMLAENPGTVNAGTDLVLTDGAMFKAAAGTAGEIACGKSWSQVTSTAGGLVQATLKAEPVAKA